LELKHQPFKTEIEEALEKALAESAKKSKEKKKRYDGKGGARGLSLTGMQLERLDRFEEFMTKWEPELEYMKQMITELHKAEFPEDNVDSMLNPVEEGGRG
jgi:hypothetical protein